MNDPNLKENISGQTSAQNSPHVLDDVQLLWHELRVLIHDHFKIAALEVQQAAKGLVVMVIAGIMIAVLLIGAWLGLAAAGTLWLIEHGMLQSYAILIGIAFNLLIALILGVVIRRKSRYLQFPAVRRSILSMPPQWERKT